MGIGTYDVIMAAIIVCGAVIGYICGLMKMLRTLISLVAARFLFVFACQHFTGMTEIKELMRKMISTGIGKLVANGNITADIAAKLTGTKHMITAEEMLASYVASLAVFAILFLVIRVVIGLIITTVVTPKRKLLYFLDKFAGFTAGAILAEAVLMVAFMVIMSMAYVGSPGAATMLQNVHETVIFRIATKFI